MTVTHLCLLACSYLWTAFIILADSIILVTCSPLLIIPTCSITFHAYASSSISSLLHVLYSPFLLCTIKHTLESKAFSFDPLTPETPSTLSLVLLIVTQGQSVSSWIPPLRQLSCALTSKRASCITHTKDPYRTSNLCVDISAWPHIAHSMRCIFPNKWWFWVHSILDKLNIISNQTSNCDQEVSTIYQSIVYWNAYHLPKCCQCTAKKQWYISSCKQGYKTQQAQMSTSLRLSLN